MRSALLSCVALFLVVGCSNTASGLKQDAQVNGQKSAAEGQDLSKKGGDAAKDLAAAAVLTPKVKMAISADKKLNEPANLIDVDSDEHTVTLKGHVTSGGQKSLAGDLAAKVLKENGAHQELRNELEVKA